MSDNEAQVLDEAQWSNRRKDGIAGGKPYVGQSLKKSYATSSHFVQTLGDAHFSRSHYTFVLRQNTLVAVRNATSTPLT